jgi:hypothetical protein
MCVVVVTVVCLSAVKVHIDQSAQPRNGGAIASSEERERERERERVSISKERMWWRW